MSHNEDVWKELFLHPTATVKHILLAGVGIHLFQQTFGIDTVVLYSPKIFEKAGITNENFKLLATVAVGFVRNGRLCGMNLFSLLNLIQIGFEFEFKPIWIATQDIYLSRFRKHVIYPRDPSIQTLFKR
ncbi:unnamed protein product [Camellia sinensis]